MPHGLKMVRALPRELKMVRASPHGLKFGYPETASFVSKKGTGLLLLIE